MSELNLLSPSTIETASMQWFSLPTWSGFALAAAAMAGCGYPVDPESWLPDFGIHGDYGAIAVNYADSIGALTARYLNQDEADSRALELCGRGCEIALRFQGAGQCGAVASAGNGAIGVASGKPQATADASALESCRKEGGADCAVRLQGCNE